MKKINYIIIGIGIFFLLIDFIFLNKNLNIMYFLAIIILIAIALPFVLIIVAQSKSHKQKEARFLEFTRDLVENVKSGTPIGKSILNLKTRDYGTLTPHVQKLINQLNLGIPLTTSLVNFSKDTESKVISRAVGLIVEAERSGGEIDSLLASVASSVGQIEELKKQQQSSVYSLVVQGYIIFIVFILIVLVLQYYILPMVGGIEGTNDLNVDIALNKNVDMSKPLLYLLIVQSAFAGLVIGKISGGNIKDGIKHSFILLALTLLISFGARAMFG